MIEVFVFIDPGFSGALSTFHQFKKPDGELHFYPASVHDMPVIKDIIAITKGKKKPVTKKIVHNRLNIPKLFDIIGNDTTDVKKIMVVLEEPQLRFKDSKQSLRTSFREYGKMIGVLEFLGIEYKEVSPIDWKAKVFPDNRGKKKDKKRLKTDSVILAGKLYPGLKKQLVGKRKGLKDGRAEALLLGYYYFNFCDKGH